MKKFYLILLAVLLFLTTAAVFCAVSAEEDSRPAEPTPVPVHHTADQETDEKTQPEVPADPVTAKDPVFDPDEFEDEFDEEDFDEEEFDEDLEDEEDFEGEDLEEEDPAGEDGGTGDDTDGEENGDPELTEEPGDGEETENPEATPEEPGTEPEVTETVVPTEEPDAVPTEIPTEEPEAVDDIIHDLVTVTIAGVQDTFEYDGKDHEAEGYMIVDINHPFYTEGDFEFRGDAAAKRVGAGVSYMGLSANDFRNTNDKFEKVRFEVTDGFVKITPTTTTVTIKGGQVTAPFDGGMHEAFGFDIVSIESPLYNASDFAFLGDAFVERSEVGISGMGLSEDQFENVNRNFEYVNFIVTDGFIEITESDLPVQEEVFPEDFEDEDLTDETAEPEETPAEVEAPVTVETEAAPAEGETAETTETEAAPAEGEVTETPETEETPAEGEVMETPEAEETPAEGEVTETPETDETPGEGEVTETPETDETPGEGEVTETPEAEETPAEGEVTETPETEETPAEGEVTETPEPEAAPGTVMVAAGTSIYAEADPESEVILVTEADTEFVVLGSDENWLNVQLSEDGSGYISRADIPEVEETPAEEDPNVYVIVPAGTDVRADADGMSEIIFTTEEETKMVFIGVEGDWTQVMIDENTVGFIFGADLNLDDKPESAGMKVTIFTSRRSQMEVGEDITLTAVLEGFDDVQNLQYQWECDKGDGFEPVEGATGESYSYPATAESFSWSWRLHLSFD